MEVALLIAIISIANILCFFIGAIVGQKVVKQEELTLNPVKVVSEAIDNHKAKSRQEEIDRYFDTLNQNIDNYDGTGLGQKDLPKI